MARPHRGIFFWLAASLGACAGCICDPLVVLSVCLTLFTACVLVDVFCALAPDEKELWPPRSGGKPAPGEKPHVEVKGTDRPLVTLGQGDYQQHIRPSDLTDAERKALEN